MLAVEVEAPRRANCWEVPHLESRGINAPGEGHRSFPFAAREHKPTDARGAAPRDREGSNLDRRPRRGSGWIVFRNCYARTQGGTAYPAARSVGVHFATNRLRDRRWGCSTSSHRNQPCPALVIFMGRAAANHTLGLIACRDRTGFLSYDHLIAAVLSG